MTDRPILFSAPMIHALLEGRKTQTRRVLKPQPAGMTRATLDQFGDWWTTGKQEHTFTPPKYRLNDRLWVREAWRVGAWRYSHGTIALDYCDGPRKEWLEVEDGDLHCRLIDQSREDARKAGVNLNDGYHEYTWQVGDSPCRWRPSFHMPRWASRLTLPVTDVWVQRLQDISEADAIAEGIEPWGIATWKDYTANGPTHVKLKARDSFRTLWDSINAAPKPVGGKKITHYTSYPWGGEPRTETYRGKPHYITPNPWVSATTFTVHQCNIDKMEQTT